MKMTYHSISDRTEKNVKRGFLVSGSLFLAVAIISFIAVFFGQKNRIENTHGWEKTRCTVVVRGVSIRSKKNRRHYYWLIKYKYDFDGEEHASTEYSLLERGPYIGSASRLNRKLYEKTKKMVEENSGPYAEGSERNCYVNPDNPEESLLVLVQPTILNTLRFLYYQVWQAAISIVILIVGIVLIKCGLKKAPDWSD